MHRFAAHAGLEVGGAEGHGSAQGGAVANDYDAAVVVYIGPLVRIGGPGIRQVEAVGEAPKFWGNASPKAERSVNMNPGALLFCAAAEFGGGIEGAGIHIAGLDAQNGALAQVGQ